MAAILNFKKLRAGNYLELTSDINCIPKGIYRFEEEEEGMLYFRIGKKIEFAIEAICADKLRLLPKSRAVLIRTPAKNFVVRYYELLKELRYKPFDPNLPFTRCGIDSSLVPLEELQYCGTGAMVEPSCRKLIN